MNDDYPEIRNLVEGSYRTGPPPSKLVDRALAIECPDCNINVFLEEDDAIDGLFHTKVTHDDTCPRVK